MLEFIAAIFVLFGVIVTIGLVLCEMKDKDTGYALGAVFSLLLFFTGIYCIKLDIMNEKRNEAINFYKYNPTAVVSYFQKSDEFMMPLNKEWKLIWVKDGKIAERGNNAQILYILSDKESQ